MFILRGRGVDRLYFLHHPSIKVLWQLLFSLVGVPQVLSSIAREILLGWHVSFIHEKCKKVLTVSPLCILWTIWNEGNQRLFEKEEQSI